MKLNPNRAILNHSSNVLKPKYRKKIKAHQLPTLGEKNPSDHKPSGNYYTREVNYASQTPTKRKLRDSA